MYLEEEGSGGGGRVLTSVTYLEEEGSGGGGGESLIGRECLAAGLRAIAKCWRRRGGGSVWLRVCERSPRVGGGLGEIALRQTLKTQGFSCIFFGESLL